MDIQPIKDVTGERIVVIDLDTGTVLGRNLVMVYVPSNVEDIILDSDSEAREWGKMYGTPLLADLDEEF